MDRTEVVAAPFPTNSDQTLIGRTTEIGHAVHGFDGDLSFGGLALHFSALQGGAGDDLVAPDLSFSS